MGSHAGVDGAFLKNAIPEIVTNAIWEHESPGNFSEKSGTLRGSVENRRKMPIFRHTDVPLFRFPNPGIDGILRDSIFSKYAIMITVKERDTGQAHRAAPDAASTDCK